MQYGRVCFLPVLYCAVILGFSLFARSLAPARQMYYNICPYNTMALLLLQGTAVQFIYRALLVLTHCSTVLYIPANSRYDLLHLINQSINKQINGQMISCAFFSLSLFFFFYPLVWFRSSLFFFSFRNIKQNRSPPPPLQSRFEDRPQQPEYSSKEAKNEEEKKEKKKQQASRQGGMSCNVTQPSLSVTIPYEYSRDRIGRKEGN